MHGVRVCAEWKFQVMFEDPRCLNLYRKAGELGMPVVLHLDVAYLPDAEGGAPHYCPNWYGGNVDNLERALIACPKTNFIGHAPGFWRYISGDAETRTEAYPKGPVTPGGRLYELFDRYPNLYADLSAGSGLGALSRDPEHAVKFMTRYADRLLWGRDYYGDALPKFLESIDLPKDVRKKVECTNAQGLIAGAK
jgi:predicted TIM-barrel fold metal-dependent hydrolase